MSAALIQKLIEAGTPAELIAEVATELAEARAAAKTLENKRAYDREYQRGRRKNRTTSYESNDVVEQKVSEVSPAPLPTFQKPIPPAPKGASPHGKLKGRRLEPDWQPSPVTGKAAEMVACWQSGELERELAKFKNYWLAKGANAARTDWQRTWVNWLISADERKPRYDGRSDHNPTGTALARVQAAIRSGSIVGGTG